MIATRRLAEMTLQEKELLSSPYGFGKYYLGLPIYDEPTPMKVGECRSPSEVYYEIFRTDWQKQAVNAVGRFGAKTSVRTANGAGKTSTLIPTAALWWMTVYPRSKVVITSGGERQVKSQIFPNLKRAQPRLPGWEFNDTNIVSPNGSACVGFSTNDGGLFEGWHGNPNELYDIFAHDGPLLIIVDEAKSIAQEIFDAIDRCTYQHLLLASSCGGAEGEFYKSHNDFAKYYTTFQAPSGICPHADHAKNRELIEKRGINDPLVRSKVFAEFMTTAEGTIIARVWIDRCTAHARQHMAGTRNAFCDFAAGGDENVFAQRDGNRVQIVDAWREKDTMQACGKFIQLFRKAGYTPETANQIGGDNDGLGKVVIDRLHELGWHIRRESNGDKADNASDYFNRGTETWYEGAKKIEKGEIILPDDSTLIAQLTTRKGRVSSDGRLAVEAKPDMKKRGVESPDRADAVLGCIRGSVFSKPIQFSGQFNNDMGLLEQMIEEQGGELAGAFCP